MDPVIVDVPVSSIGLSCSASSKSVWLIGMFLYFHGYSQGYFNIYFFSLLSLFYVVSGDYNDYIFFLRTTVYHGFKFIKLKIHTFVKENFNK